VAAFSNRRDGRQLARTSRTDDPDRSVGVGRPDDRHQVAGHRGHLRVDHAEHRIRGDGSVDGIAAIAQHLRAGLGSEAVRGGDDPLGHSGII
jgi:hypothetical protein